MLPKPERPKIIQKRFEAFGDYGMVSAHARQGEIKLWEYTVGRKGRYWFWPAASEVGGEQVHVGSPIRAGFPNPLHSDGYGGSTLDFATKDGVFSVQGPWHSNADALFNGTGVDLRRQHWTWGIVALDREHVPGKWNPVYVDVIYMDPPKGVVGEFERVDKIAHRIAYQLQREVFCYRKSSGGSSDGPVKPRYFEDEIVEACWRRRHELQTFNSRG